MFTLFRSENRIVNLFTFEKRTGAEHSATIIRGFMFINNCQELNAKQQFEKKKTKRNVPLILIVGSSDYVFYVKSNIFSCPF